VTQIDGIKGLMTILNKNGLIAKKCRLCGEIKSLDDFPNHKECLYGKDTRCKACRKTYLAKYHSKNRDKILKSRVEYHKKYRKENRDAIRKRQKKYKRSLKGRLLENVRKRVHQYVYAHINHKKVRDIVKEDIGCSVDFLIQYLEKKFKPGMNWDNYGEWHIDHIFPVSKVNLENEEELQKVCHYSNLQPLWAKENMSKGSKIMSKSILV